MAFLGVGSAAVCAPLNPVSTEAELAFSLDDLTPAAVVVAPELEPRIRGLAEARGIPLLDLSIVDGGDGVSGPDPSREPEPDDVAPGAAHLGHDGTTEAGAAQPRQPVPLGAQRGGDARPRALRPLPQRHAALPHPRPRRRAVRQPGRGGERRVHSGVRPAALPRLDRAARADLVLGGTHHPPGGARGRLARRRAAGPKGLFRFVRSSSAALPTTVLADLEAHFGCPVVEAYGMTEAAHQMASNPLPPGVRKPGTVGRATGLEIAVVDEVGRPVATGAARRDRDPRRRT